MDYADDHLSRVVQQQIPVLKLAIDIAVIGSEFGGVDQFMELLYLSKVLLFSEDSLSNIANLCPEIEIIEFNFCNFWINNLNLSEFRKLKKASVIGHKRNLESIDIRETNLESFHCNCQELYCLINLVTCRNIRVLELNECYLSEPYLVSSFATLFPFLEKAKLCDAITSRSCSPIIVANAYLRSLSLLYSNLIVDVISVKCPNLSHFTCLTAGFEDVYLHCPKLRTCCYKTSARVPRLILLDLPTDIQYIEFSLFVNDKLSKLWFIYTKKFLEQIPGCTNVYLHFRWLRTSRNMVANLLCVLSIRKDEFVPDELKAINTSQPKNVRVQVEIGGTRTWELTTAFVDSLVWSTCPTTLSKHLWLNKTTKSSTKFDSPVDLQYLCGKLAEKSRDKSCCDQQFCSKYWWHNISDFEVKHKKRDMTQKLTSLEEMTKPSRTAKFLVEMAGSDLNT
ncbi:F-box protein SKP2A [Bienertia sinuspersici]